MKILIIIIVSLITITTTHPHTELGLGVIEVDINQTKEIRVFANKEEKEPEKAIRLVKLNGDIIIEEKDYSKWLKPESVWLDYSQFLFRFTKIEGDWIQIIINNDSGGKKWIKKSTNLKNIYWDKFLIDNTTAIGTPISIEIKIAPSTESKTLRRSSTKDCFEAVEIKGDWLKIKTNETLECNEHPEPIKSGWIKWKSDNKLIIDYFLTC